MKDVNITKDGVMRYSYQRKVASNVVATINEETKSIANALLDCDAEVNFITNRNNVEDDFARTNEDVYGSTEYDNGLISVEMFSFKSKSIDDTMEVVANLLYQSISDDYNEATTFGILYGHKTRKRKNKSINELVHYTKELCNSGLSMDDYLNDDTITRPEEGQHLDYLKWVRMKEMIG